MAVVHRTDPTARDQFARPVDGKHKIAIRGQPGVVKVMARVAVEQRLGIHIRRYRTEGYIAAPFRIVETLHTWGDERRAGDKGEFAFGQRLS